MKNLVRFLFPWIKTEEEKIKETVVDRISMFREQVNEINRKRNLGIANGHQEKNFKYLDHPEPMLLINLKKPINNKSEFLQFLNTFVGVVYEHEICENDGRKGWCHDIYSCESGSTKVFCNAEPCK